MENGPWSWSVQTHDPITSTIDLSGWLWEQQGIWALAAVTAQPMGHIMQLRK